MGRSIGKIAKNLARKQLNGKDIRSKIASECEYNGWSESKMKRLVKEEIQMMEGKR